MPQGCANGSMKRSKPQFVNSKKMLQLKSVPRRPKKQRRPPRKRRSSQLKRQRKRKKRQLKRKKLVEPNQKMSKLTPQQSQKLTMLMARRRTAPRTRSQRLRMSISPKKVMIWS